MSKRKEASERLPALPTFLSRKLFKTGQTRGADDDEIFQNRVSRNSTVLIPFDSWNPEMLKSIGHFENGFIVLVPPSISEQDLRDKELVLGENSVYFYETRSEWDSYNPDQKGFRVASSRIAPLGGEYVARVPATTAHDGGEKINRGFTRTDCKGAGIRFFEYASSDTINKARIQLEAVFWHCFDAIQTVVSAGMRNEDAIIRKKLITKQCRELGLLNYSELKRMRILNVEHETICPLCLEVLSGKGFMSRLAQAEGRSVPDLTVTEISLFHIEELRAGQFNHRPYNLGWGHHYCNVVAKVSPQRTPC